MLLHIATKEREKKHLQNYCFGTTCLNRVPKDSYIPPVKTDFHLNRWFNKYKLDYNNMKGIEHFVSLQTSAVLAEVSRKSKSL